MTTHEKSHDRLTCMRKGNDRKPLPSHKLPLLGSNQDSSDPESDVLPVTPRGKDLVVPQRVARSS